MYRSAVVLDQVSRSVKNFTSRIFLDTINVINVKLCVMRFASLSFYLFRHLVEVRVFLRKDFCIFFIGM